jgi:hypothetical protein
MKKYFPILLSKKGELVALQHLTQAVKEDICPVIEVLRDSLEKTVKEKNSPTITVYKDELENFLKTHWAFFNNRIILDFSLVSGIDEKIEDIKKLIKSLLKSGVNIIPAIQENSSWLFKKTIKEIIHENRLGCCIHTSEFSGGFDNYKSSIEALVKEIGLDEDKIVLLLNLGNAKKDNINYLTSSTKTYINSLNKRIGEWMAIVVASSSFPQNLTDIKPANQVHKLPRHEWSVWKNLISKEPQMTGIKYGDFGTKYPYYEEVSFQGTVSVKYTTENDFIIYRGELTKESEHGHGQYIIHAQKLIKSSEYSGKEFSWGDLRIYEIASQSVDDDKKKTGSATTWVQISQNHHITLLNSLL